MTALNLSAFNNRLMNGLIFSKKVYDLYEQTRKSPNGLEKLRLRRNKSEKKLIEELVPLAKYVQALYTCGRQLRIRWIDGRQRYDAVLFSSGYAAEKGRVEKRLLIEVTTSVHKNHHWRQELLNKQGWA
jgi:hypothetical protein